MLINLLPTLYDPETLAAFSGSMIFTVSQNTYRGLNKLLIFFVSFLMGFVGADIAVALIKGWLPAEVQIGREIGAFIASTRVVTVSMRVIERADKHLSKEDKNS